MAGKQRSGKTEAARWINELCGGLLTPSPFSRAIKEIVAKERLCSLDEIESRKNVQPEVRRRLVEVSLEHKASDLLVWVKEALKTAGNLIIADTRFPYELDAVEAVTPHVIKVLVKADREVRAERGVLGDETDESETALDDLPADTWDYIIDNNNHLDHLIAQCMPVANAVFWGIELLGHRKANRRVEIPTYK